ncbi:menaquinone biosynthesis protein [Ferruginibacter lapsinanis]|uniref:menaquinone biosynthetic enzyme MqnA/MqnD family protein n=1 Tax=Ferruginibacter lapsinanis TaxID=563172 RepID=UPI001E435074|nr:menaquinone biosynthesis protein [Ferruginibacter lapsinanis]UEG49045.1 menaquinone biosynthesis protein [Ferruginibacter lapsinanis]
MDKKIRVGAVSYLNTKPLIYGFEHGLMKDEIELVIDYPANIADALINEQIDIGLVPMAVIPKLKEHHIIGDYCIACDGEVASVCLFSEVPVHEIETIILDYQSRTSVALVQILMSEYWKLTPRFVNGGVDFRSEIKGTTAAVVIGDRALEQRKSSPYIYDLGTAWKAYTGLPFVFAAWVSNKPVADDFIKKFNEANALGFKNMNQIVEKYSIPDIDLMKYYTQFIKFELNIAMHESIALFLSKLKQVK